jgi:hypothetical protein
MKYIENVRYAMDLGGGGDVWRIHGFVEGKPIRPSTVKSFNKEKDIFGTVSGSTYHILSYGQDKDKFFEQVEKDIKNNGYEVH